MHVLSVISPPTVAASNPPRVSHMKEKEEESSTILVPTHVYFCSDG